MGTRRRRGGRRRGKIHNVSDDGVRALLLLIIIGRYGKDQNNVSTALGLG